MAKFITHLSIFDAFTRTITKGAEKDPLKVELPYHLRSLKTNQSPPHVEQLTIIDSDTISASKSMSIFQHTTDKTNSHTKSYNRTKHTLDKEIKDLESGHSFHPDLKIIHYSFYDPNGLGNPSYRVQENFKAAFEQYQHYIDMTFIEVQDPNRAEIRISLSTKPDYAHAYFPFNGTGQDVASDIFINPKYDNLSLPNGLQNTTGYHGFLTILHEIGHTLGLKHPPENDTETSVSPSNPDQESYNLSNTIMTYNFTGYKPSTPMLFDISVLQKHYGTAEFHPSDTYYHFQSTYEYAVNGIPNLIGDYNKTKTTIWDSGGHDTFDFSDLAYSWQGYLFDLNPGGWIINKSAYRGAYYDFGTSIAYDTLIEAIVNSASNDEIFLNDAANTISGYGPSKETGFDIIHQSDIDDILDLSGFKLEEVGFLQQDSDLLVELNYFSKICVANYFDTTHHLQIHFDDVVLV